MTYNGYVCIVVVVGMALGYTVFGEEKGKDKTMPVNCCAWLYEQYLIYFIVWTVNKDNNQYMSQNKIMRCLDKANGRFLTELDEGEKEEAVQEFRRLWSGSYVTMQSKNKKSNPSSIATKELTSTSKPKKKNSQLKLSNWL